MKNEEIKIGSPSEMNFFKRVYVSIFKVENYGEFILEKTKVAVKYLFLLLFIVSVLMAVASTYSVHKIFVKGFNYVKNEMPDFILIDGTIAFAEDTEAYDKDLDFYVKYETSSELSDGVIEDLEKNVKQYSKALIYMPDRIVYYDGNSFSKYKYMDLISEYNIEISNKQDLIDNLSSVGIAGLDSVFFVASVLSSYIVNIINVFLDIILVLCFGLIAARLSGVTMPTSKMFALAIYSLTLSIILGLIYNIAYTFTNFYIEYFEFMYIAIAYIYLIAAILIIKSDAIKQKMELQKIIEVQKEVKEELEEQKEEEDNKDEEKEDKEGKKDDKKEKGEDPVINGEPDGSEI